MSIALMPQRPPYVTFEQRAVEDRNASIAAGGMVMRDVDFVIVRQVGSKNTLEKDAAEWLADLERLVANGNYPRRVGARTSARSSRRTRPGSPSRNWACRCGSGRRCPRRRSRT